MTHPLREISLAIQDWSHFNDGFQKQMGAKAFTNGETNRVKFKSKLDTF